MPLRSVPLLRHLKPSTRLWLKERTPAWVASRLRPNAVRTLRAPARPGRTDAPLFVLMCTWNEEDIVHASVKNAFDLGADRVFLMDNGSTDSTVSEAISAGAELVMSFVTEQFDELYKYRLMNGEIRRISETAETSHIWWWLKDADEFLEVPGDQNLVEFLADVDSRCRIVGARVFDHYPLPGRPYVPRTDPITVQPLCREKVDHRCTLTHHKHPVFLWKAAGREIAVEPGFHQLRCHGEVLYEPPTSLVLHHHPFRNEADARSRLVALRYRGSTKATADASADSHMRARLESLEAVYRGDYSQVIDYRTGERGIVLSDWAEIAQAQS